MKLPQLRFLHHSDTLLALKLQQLSRVSTEELEQSLPPGMPGSLKVRSDGTVLDGHHRLHVLSLRGVNIHVLPREIMDRES